MADKNVMQGILDNLVFLPKTNTDARALKFDGVSGIWYNYKPDLGEIAVFFHGNATVAADCDIVCMKISTKFGNCPVFCFDPSGYGVSSGKPSTSNIETDANKCYIYLLSLGYKPENINIYGHSIGGAYALVMARSSTFKSVTLRSVFCDMKDAMSLNSASLPPGFKEATLSIVKLYNNSETVSKFNGDAAKTPIVFMHSRTDEIIPFDSMRKLRNLMNSKGCKTEIVMLNGTHNNFENI